MSVSSITSNLLHQQQMQSQQSSRSSFADLTSALTSGAWNSSASSSPGGLLSLLSGSSLSAASSSGTSPSGTASPATTTLPSAQLILMRELTALGAQLQAGNLSGAQQAYSTFAKDLGTTGDQGPSRFHGHGSHPRPVYSADASNLATSNSEPGSNSAGTPAVVA